MDKHRTIGDSNKEVIKSKLDDLLKQNMELRKSKMNEKIKHNELYKKYQKCIHQNKCLKKKNKNLMDLILKYKQFMEKYKQSIINDNVSKSVITKTDNKDDIEMKTLSVKNDQKMETDLSITMKRLLIDKLTSCGENYTHIIQRTLCQEYVNLDVEANKINNVYISNIICECIKHGIINIINDQQLIECKYNKYIIIIETKPKYKIRDLVVFDPNITDEKDIITLGIQRKHRFYFKIKQVAHNAKLTKSFTIINNGNHISYKYFYNEFTICFASNHSTICVFDCNGKRLSDIQVDDNGLSDKLLKYIPQQPHKLQQYLPKKLKNLKKECCRLIARLVCSLPTGVDHNNINYNDEYVMNVIYDCIKNGAKTQITNNGMMEYKYNQYTLILSKKKKFIHDLVIDNNHINDSITVISFFKEKYYFKVKQLAINAKASNDYQKIDVKNHVEYVYVYNQCRIIFASNHRTVTSLNVVNNNNNKKITLDDILIDDNGLSQRYAQLLNPKKQISINSNNNNNNNNNSNVLNQKDDIIIKDNNCFRYNIGASILCWKLDKDNNNISFKIKILKRMLNNDNEAIYYIKQENRNHDQNTIHEWIQENKIILITRPINMINNQQQINSKTKETEKSNYDNKSVSPSQSRCSLNKTNGNKRHKYLSRSRSPSKSPKYKYKYRSRSRSRSWSSNGSYYSRSRSIARSPSNSYEDGEYYTMNKRKRYDQYKRRKYSNSYRSYSRSRSRSR